MENSDIWRICSRDDNCRGIIECESACDNLILMLSSGNQNEEERKPVTIVISAVERSRTALTTDNVWLRVMLPNTTTEALPTVNSDALTGAEILISNKGIK